jgi:hypothetical protein
MLPGIPPGSTSSLSAAEAAARLAKFLRANRDRLLKLSGEEEITRSAYREGSACVQIRLMANANG